MPQRKTQLSVTIFPYFGEEYLFLLRNKDRKVDASRLNGIGGKLEKGENYLAAAIRETQEEAGYTLTEKELQFVGMVHLHGGYEDDWVMAFFKACVPSRGIPIGTKTAEGTLLWLPKDTVLHSGYELVDDLNYTWDKIAQGKEIFFMEAEVGADEKIKKVSFNSLALS